jgi:hypothetical protein
VAYEVSVTCPPAAAIDITATYDNVTSPLRLTVGYPNWPYPTLSVLKDMKFSSSDGKSLSWTKLDSRTIQVVTTGASVVAKYTVDLATLSQHTGVAVRLEALGGVMSGSTAFLTPDSQNVSSAKVRFSVPTPWQVVSDYPEEDGWFIVQPYTFGDLASEVRYSGWYFGNIDFDQTKTYDDGFGIRVVGFKYFDYEHWTVYSGDTPLEEALKTADFYHATYVKIRSIYGEYPLPKLLLVGPGLWQAGNTYLRQSIIGWNRYESISHHMLHAFFQSRIDFTERFYYLLSEGYSTYSEGIMTAEVAKNPMWRGMLYERKFHYLRGQKFDNMGQNDADYVLGLIVTYLMDREIRSETNGQKGINDVMVRIWKEYNNPETKVWVTDEQVLGALKEVTGKDCHWFYDKNVVDTSHLDVDQLDDLKQDFKTFLKVEADTWYNGYQSMYFVSQEITSAIGDFDRNVRMQCTLNSPSVGDFAVAARRYKDVTQADLTEQDVEQVLHQMTGKDHSDFFQFYRNLGFTVDPKEISDYVRTFTYTWSNVDNAVKLLPNTFAIGKTSDVVGEIVDPDYANAQKLGMDVIIYDMPKGLASPQDLVTGPGVSVALQMSYEDGGNFSGPFTHLMIQLPKVKIGDKTYTFFKLNLPQDAGIVTYGFYAQNGEIPSGMGPHGGYVGTKKVFFQSPATFCAKTPDYKIVDDVPPIFSVTSPTESATKVMHDILHVEGLVEPDATVSINGQAAAIDSSAFTFAGDVKLAPGQNTVTVEARDQAGNEATKTVMATVAAIPTYTLTPSVGTGGSITPNTPQTVLQDGDMIFTIVPNTGYHIANVSVDGASQGTITSYTFTNVTSNHSISATFEQDKKPTIIVLQIGNSSFTVDGGSKTLDSPPVIKNGRTLVPIRAIIEALGGTIGWDATARKATVTLGNKTIELWIGKSTASVNGVNTPIDVENAKVVPEIISGRTMLPLRFVTERLGATLGWDQNTQTITITYQP